QTLADFFPLLLAISDFRLDCLHSFQQPGMSLDGVRVGWVVAKGDAGLAEEFLEKLIHGFEAVGVARIVAQQDVMLQEKNVVFAAVKKNQPVLAKLVIRSEIFAKESAAGFCDDVVFHVDHNLRHLLAHSANDAPPGGLRLAQTCYDDARRQPALGAPAALATPPL